MQQEHIMSHRIELTPEDQKIILKVMVASLEDKCENVIRNATKREHTQREYESAAEKFLKPIICGRSGYTAGDNLFGWLIDQIDHSPHVKNTELGERAINIARACGRNRYEEYQRVTENNFHNLFH